MDIENRCTWSFNMHVQRLKLNVEKFCESTYPYPKFVYNLLNKFTCLFWKSSPLSFDLWFHRLVLKLGLFSKSTCKQNTFLDHIKINCTHRKFLNTSKIHVQEYYEKGSSFSFNVWIHNLKLHVRLLSISTCIDQNITHTVLFNCIHQLLFITYEIHVKKDFEKSSSLSFDICFPTLSSMLHFLQNFPALELYRWSIHFVCFSWMQFQKCVVVGRAGNHYSLRTTICSSKQMFSGIYVTIFATSLNFVFTSRYYLSIISFSFRFFQFFKFFLQICSHRHLPPNKNVLLNLI